MNTDPISAAAAYRMALERIMRAKVFHEARQIASSALEIHFTRPEEGTVSVASGFGQNTRQPFVTLGMANPQEVANPAIQMTTTDARRIAMQILEAADAAESDGFIVSWLGDKAELNDPQLAALLSEFREYRARLRGEEED